MTDEEALREVLDALEAIGASYMIVGSMASSTWGVPRSTQDSDVVVELDQARLAALAARLLPSWYIPEALSREAVERHGMFNIIRKAEAAKVDLIIRADTDHAKRALSRRVLQNLCGRPAAYASPEDTVLAKLLWYRRGGGEMQLRDCAGIVQVRGGSLDLAYLRREAEPLGVSDLLDTVLAP